MIEIKNITIGADPELFFKKDGEIISAEGLVGGTKQEPKSISDLGHAVQEDNVMAEFNIPPSSNATSFKDDINYVLDYLSDVATSNGAELAIEASAKLDKKYLGTKQAKLFGCDPDYNVYLKCTNTPPSTTGTIRTCAGHIHVGYDKPDVKTSEKIVKAMDLFLGVPSILMDEDTVRRNMYGKAGCFRFKKYGMEFRTISNFWLKTDELKEWAFNSTMNAIEFINNEDNYKLLLKMEKEIVSCINNNDKDLALDIINRVEQITLIENKILETI